MCNFIYNSAKNYFRHYHQSKKFEGLRSLDIEDDNSFLTDICYKCSLDIRDIGTAIFGIDFL